MSGLLPDSTPGILPAQWLEILQKQQASPDFAIQLQLLTDEQLLSSSKGKVTRGLNQQKRGGGGGARADAKQQQKKGGQPRAGGGWASSASSDGGSAGAGSEGTSLDAIDEDEAASTNVESRVSKASALSNRDPNDSDFTDATRSVGRSEINSVIGLPAPSESADESTVGRASQSQHQSSLSADSSAGGPRLTASALDRLNNALKDEPYNELKRKLRKHLDKRRTGRVAQDTEDSALLPSCFHTGGLYDPRMGGVEVRVNSGEHAGRWHIWCATCNEGQVPACPSCGEVLAQSSYKDESGKRKLRLMRCVGCSAEVKRESITTDPHPACPGHYCHVRLPRDMWVVNPLQWGDVIAMLRGSCWWCYRWKASLFDVRRKVASLRLLNARLWTPELEGYLDRTFSSSIMAKTTAPQRKAGRKKRKIAGKPPLDTAEEGEDEELHAESAPVKNTDEQGDEMMDWVASFLQEAEATVPVAERAPVGSFFAQRRKVVNDVWKLIAGVPASAPCRHCGLKTPKKITDYKKTALFYDIPGKDMDANIAAAAGRKGACGPKATWTSVRVALAEFKAETEINKGGGQVVHQKKVGRAGGKGKSLREAAPRSNVYLPPHRIQAQLEGLFFCEQESLGEVFYQVCSAPDSVDPELSVPAKDYWKAFVHRVVEVGPNKFRPFREGDGAVQADDQTKQISNLLACARNMVTIGSRFVGRSSKQSRTRPGKTARPVVAFWKARPRTFEFCARAAQDSYRRIMFSGASADAKPGKGTQQIFEKKSGLFRTNLMGKRVNQACRSVISPDNNLEDNQVLLSRRFAKRLTIPEVLPSPARIAALQEQAAAQPYLQGQVTVLKARRGFLQHSILNGASVYPGATRVEMDADDAAQIPFAYSLLLKARRPKFVSKTLTIDDVQLIDVSRATGKKALELVLWMERVLGDAVKTGAAKMGPGLDGVRFKVFRHVATDDWVILNRQPTLHKSSWLGQRLVVASNQRTIRFHYANCKGFNADFDGDEMNVHVPQTERAQVELRVLNSARQHFVSSTSGKPVRGLIQDHVVSGVLATMRDTFLSGGQFDRLIHHCLHKLGAPMPPRPEPAVRVRHRNKTGPGHHWVEAWTGKQLVSTVLGFVTANYSQVGRYSGGVCFEGRSALPASVWDDRPAAERPDFAADKFMEDDQVEVIFDTMVRGVVDKNQLGATSGTLVEHVHEVHGAEAAGTLICIFGRLFTEYLSHHGFTVGITDLMLKNDNETARSRLLRSLDASIVGKATEADRLGTVMKKTGELNKAMFPSGMAKQLPQNCLALMTMSGAKGSGVNATQMAVLLGQQTFDGHRVQCMPSGKTLPGTLLGDDRASCGGFGLGRFLSGIRPQQYVVHAAAGRDGLIDTAVKTSRSGYLQRSVIKGMEGLATKWLHGRNAEGDDELSAAVVDEAGGIVQFKFGHDGLDPQKSVGWKQGKEPPAVAHHAALAVLNGLGKRKRDWRGISNHQLQREIDTEVALHRAPAEFTALSVKLHAEGGKKAGFKTLKASEVASVHLITDAPNARAEKMVKVEVAVRNCATGAAELEVGFVEKSVVKRVPGKAVKEALGHIAKQRVLQASMATDEPVGIVAAQSVGEPSTQMTLNTFHQAGQTVSHVTEGIPRLRQILQSASVSEPMVLLPVENLTPPIAACLLRMHALLTPKPLADVLIDESKDCHLPKWSVTTKPVGPGEQYKTMDVTLRIDEAKLDAYYMGEHGVSPAVNKGKGDRSRDEVRGVFVNESAPPKVFDSIGRPLLRVQPKKPTGAVGDVHTALTALHKAITREVHRSWNWDRTHDPLGIAARMGPCQKPPPAPKAPPQPRGEEEQQQQQLQPPAKKSAKTRGKGEEAEPAGGAGGDAKYTLTDGRVVDLRYLRFEDIQGHAGDTSGLTLAISTYNVAVNAKDACAEPSDDHGGAAPEKHIRSSASVSVIPHGVTRDPSRSRVLLYAFTIRLPMHADLMVHDLLDRVLNEVTLRRADTKGIKRVFFVPNQQGTGGIFHVDGGKLRQVAQMVPKLSGVPDVEKHIRFEKLRTTDYNDFVATYGVEAGQAGLLEELQRLFKSYGVNSRWLTLVTDRAMHSGVWQGFSRFSVIASSPSILHRMTFETATKFLAAASKEGLRDEMTTPAARIIFGQELSKSSSAYAALASRNQTGTAPNRKMPIAGQRLKRHRDEHPVPEPVAVQDIVQGVITEEPPVKKRKKKASKKSS